MGKAGTHLPAARAAERWTQAFEAVSKSCGQPNSSSPRKRGPRSKRLKSLGSRFRGNDEHESESARFRDWVTPASPGEAFNVVCRHETGLSLRGAHRATRQSPRRSMCGRGNCFAALAMTPPVPQLCIAWVTAPPVATCAVDGILRAGDCGARSDDGS